MLKVLNCSVKIHCIKKQTQGKNISLAFTSLGWCMECLPLDYTELPSFSYNKINPFLYHVLGPNV